MGAFSASCELALDLQRNGYLARKIKLRFNDFKTVTHDVTLPEPIDDAKALRRAATECLKRVELVKSIRLPGVKAGNLQPFPHVVAGARRPAKLRDSLHRIDRHRHDVFENAQLLLDSRNCQRRTSVC